MAGHAGLIERDQGNDLARDEPASLKTVLISGDAINAVTQTGNLLTDAGVALHSSKFKSGNTGHSHADPGPAVHVMLTAMIVIVINAHTAEGCRKRAVFMAVFRKSPRKRIGHVDVVQLLTAFGAKKLELRDKKVPQRHGQSTTKHRHSVISSRSIQYNILQFMRLRFRAGDAVEPFP